MKKLTVLAALIGFFLLGADDVSACSCIVDDRQSTGEQIRTSYKQAAAVFYGKVIAVKRESGSDEVMDVELEFVTVKFRVEKSWKGQPTSEVIVRTAGNSAACGFAFKTGKRYLVYAHSNGNGLRTSICSRTAAGSADAKYLNKIKKPKFFAGKSKRTNSSASN